MIIKFEGVLRLGDQCRVLEEGLRGAVFIGERDVVDEVANANFKNPVTVAFADKRFSGDISVEIGWGYSEWTPVDSDKITVGEHNILDALKEHEGEVVTLWVADEPVNVLEQ